MPSLGSERRSMVSKSAHRFAGRTLTRSTSDTQMPCCKRDATLPTKRSRVSGRSLFDGLTISMAATSWRPRSVS
ncbi:MAG: hypothetical protein U0797_24100 [Gemmataceae bacterium]